MQSTTKRITIIYQEGLDKSLERILFEIVRLAIKDYKRNRHRQEVIDFFYSPFFDNIMDHFNRNPDVDREKILEGKITAKLWIIE